MREAAFVPTPKVLGALVVACGRAGQLECAMSLIPSIRAGHSLPKLDTAVVPQASRRDKRLPGSLDRAAPTQGHVQSLRQHLPDLATAQHLPDLETGQPSPIFNAAGSSHASEDGSGVISKFSNTRKGPPVLETRSASASLEAAQRLEGGGTVGTVTEAGFPERHVPDVRAAQHARALEKQRGEEPNLETGSWVPSLDNWHAVLQACISCCSRERALALLPRIRSAGFFPSPSASPTLAPCSLLRVRDGINDVSCFWTLWHFAGGSGFGLGEYCLSPRSCILYVLHMRIFCVFAVLTEIMLVSHPGPGLRFLLLDNDRSTLRQC